MSDKTIIFYSGKLWNSDKPFPVKPEEQNYNPELRDHQYPDDLVIYWDKVKLWLSTAYEVVNPEVIPGVLSGKEVMKWNGTFKDGDQITLPEGYGIEKHYQPDSGPLVRRVSITLPETDYSTMITPEMNERLTKPITSFSEPGECPKCRTKEPENCHSMHCPMRKEPGNSAHGEHCGGLNCPAFEYACADVCMRPIIKEPVSEPSESQEEPFSRSIQRDLRAFIPKMVSGELDDKLKLGYVQLINGKRVELILKIEVS